MVISPLEIFCSTTYETLENIASVLNIQKDILIKSEKLAECSFAMSCSDKEFADDFSPERLNTWYSALGSDLTISVSIEEHSTYEQITCLDRSGLNRVLDVIDKFEIDVIEIRVTLKKEVLKARMIDILHIPAIDALFFFEKNLVDSLTLKSIQNMQKDGVFLANQPTIIAVLTGVGMLQSPLITVFGLKGISIEDLSQLPKRKPLLRAWEKAHSLRGSNTIWAAPLNDISPDAFQLTQVHVGLEATYETMRGFCNILSFLQFCVSVIADDEKWHASIARLGGPMIDIASNISYHDDSSSGLSPSLYRLYRWAFMAESYDKIDIVRELIQHELRDRKDNHLQHLLVSESTLLEGARANYRILRRKAFEAYLHSRQEVLEVVQSFVISTRKDLDALRKDVLNTTLQFSVGIITFLAAILQFNFSKLVITVGFSLGLFYLVLAAFFQLLPLWQQYQTQYDEAKKTVEIHNELTLTERDHLISQLPHRTGNSFTRWFWVSSIVYILWALILLCFLLFLNFSLPNVSHQNHSIPTHLTATPYPTQLPSKEKTSH